MTRSLDESPRDPTRRRFLGRSAAVAGVAWLQASLPALARAATAIARGAPPVNLDQLEAADLEAIAARIIPSDDTPGAREAGVIHFIDQALGGFMAPAKDMLLQGLAELNASLVGSDRRFADLAGAEQDAALASIQDGEFFGTLRFLTIAGFLCLPSQGGNRGEVGWKLIGFDHRHAWMPPFGHYDAADGQDPAHG